MQTQELVVCLSPVCPLNIDQHCTGYEDEIAPTTKESSPMCKKYMEVMHIIGKNCLKSF